MENAIIKFIEAYIGQVIWYATWTIPAFVILWLLLKKFLANRRIQQNQKANKTQFLKEIKNSLTTIIVFVGIDLFIFQDSQKTIETATFKVYSDFNAHGGILYIAFITLVLFVVEDTYFYWMHKTVHSPKLYKYIHKVHHESIDTTPFTSYSFHPLEAALEIVPMGLNMVIAYFFPVHILSLLIWQILSIALNVLGHSGYELFPSYWNNYWFLKWKLPATHHNMHHERFNGNYGLYFIWWDRIMGTEFPDYEEKFRSLFERKSNNKQAVAYHQLKISSIANETSNSYSIYFEKFPYEFRNYKAGQHVTLKIVVNNKTYYRTFSLSSSPTKDNFLRLTIKKIGNGFITNYLYNNFAINDTLSISEPVGNFFIEQNPANTRTLLFFAAGSGITPVYSMIKTVLHDEPNSKVILLYANKDEANCIFYEELESLQKSNKSHLKLINHFSEKEGTINKHKLETLIKSSNADEYFLCGPAGFMNLIKTTLIDSGIDKAIIKSEQFTLNTSFNTVSPDAKIVSNIKAFINEKEFHFNVLENESLLDAAIRQNINMPFLCKSGICGTCVAHCTQGKIMMNEKQQFLKPDEIASSKVLLCQSKSNSENITIEVNT